MFLSTGKEAPPNEKINIHILLKKYNMNIKKLKTCLSKGQTCLVLDQIA